MPLPLPPTPDYSSVSEESSSSSDDESDSDGDYIDNKDIVSYSSLNYSTVTVSGSNTDSGVQSLDTHSESDVYYTEVLGEDEVVYDLMYVSGHGGIQPLDTRRSSEGSVSAGQGGKNQSLLVGGE